MLTVERAVLEANLNFYDAFANADPAAMARIWSQRADISCNHPGWQTLHGRSEVLGSWKSILHNAERLLIRCSDARVAMFDQAALVTCIEQLERDRLCASNLFVFEDGLWRLMHHQASAFTKHPLSKQWPPTPDVLN